MKKNANITWPISIWNFKDKNKINIFGTIQLDAVLYGNLYLNKIEEYCTYIINNKLFSDNKQ